MFNVNLIEVSTIDLLRELKNRGAKITPVDIAEVRYVEDGSDNEFDTQKGTIIYLDHKINL